MLFFALIFISLAILLGVYLLTYVLENKATPKGIAFIHGPLAATGLLLLILYCIFHRPSPLLSTIFFILAASGGFLLIYKDITGKPIPKWLAIGHGVIALIGFELLITFMFFS